MIICFLAVLLAACSDNDDKPATYSVTFDTDGGTPALLDPQTVKSGEKAQQPEDPAKEGFDFSHWETENGATYDFSQTVNANLALKAVYVNPIISLAKGNVVSEIDKYEIVITRNGNELHRQSDSSYNYDALAAQVQDGDDIIIEGRAYTRRDYPATLPEAQVKSIQIFDDRPFDFGPTTTNDALTTYSFTDNQAERSVPLPSAQEVLVGTAAQTLKGRKFKAKKPYALVLETVGGFFKLHIDFTDVNAGGEKMRAFITMSILRAQMTDVVFHQLEIGELAEDVCATNGTGDACRPKGGKNSRAEGMDLILVTRKSLLNDALQLHIEYVDLAITVIYKAYINVNFVEGELKDLGSVVLKKKQQPSSTSP